MTRRITRIPRIKGGGWGDMIGFIAIGIAAAAHACAAMPNFLALEFHAMPGWDRILKGYRPKISNGHIEVPEGPGLGVELDEEETRKYLMDGETYFGT